jgi:GntR family transcriptional regulator, negative regulator for fad regulon and positive regulator of fabA
MMNIKRAGERSSDLIERKLVQAIIENKYPVGSYLPSERELAAELGASRPTIREALQRLERDGWIETQKGMPALVHDYWHKGNLMTLANIAQHQNLVPQDFIAYLLELRALLAPAYVREAMASKQVKVISLLANVDEVENHADAYAEFDWKLQKQLAALSRNPIYLLILNSFDSFYLAMAREYFESEEKRRLSSQFYEKFLNVALQGNVDEAELLVRDTMVQGIRLWKQGLKSKEEYDES